MPMKARAVRRMLARLPQPVDNQKDAAEVDVENEDTEPYTPPPPKTEFFCAMLDTKVERPCSLRACPLWVSHEEWKNCTGVYTAMKAAHAAERLDEDADGRGDQKRLAETADGKLAYVDIAMLYRVSRQRVEWAVHRGQSCLTRVKPLLDDAMVGLPVSERNAKVDAELDEPTLSSLLPAVPTFTYCGTAPSDICPACETPIEDYDGDDFSFTLSDGSMRWCSRECARDFPKTAFTLTREHAVDWRFMLDQAMTDSRDVGDIARRLRVTDTEVRELLEAAGYGT